MVKRNKFKLIEIFNPTDSIFILGFILGSIVAIFFNVFEIRIIGGSVSILAALRIFMIVKERSAFLPDIKRVPVEQKNFEVREVSDNSAKRTVIEDFDKQFKEDSDKSQEKSFDEKLIDKFSFFGNKNLKDNSKKEKKPETKEIKIESDELGNSITIRPMRSVADKRKDEEKIENHIDNIKNEDNIPKIEIKQEINKLEEIEEQIQNEELFQNISEFELVEDNEEQVHSEKIEKTENIEKQEPKIEDFKPKQLDYDISLLIDKEENIATGEPKKEFEFFIQRILQIIRSVSSTRTAAFLLVNHDSEELVLVACVTDQPNAITKQKKLPITNDIVSQIIKNQKPEILSDINPNAELDLIPYYTKNVGTNSFIGVPVYFGNSIAGIICADTDTNDAYDIITVGFLGHFTKLVSSLMQSYTEKFELVQAEKSIVTLKEFKESLIGKEFDSSEIFKLAISAISKNIEYTTIGIVAYDEDYQRWMIKAIMSKNQNVGYGHYEVDLNNSLIKNTINLCKVETALIENNNQLRINNSEPSIEYGFYASVPIKSFKNNFGALYLEHHSLSNINNNDLNLLTEIADTTGIALEQMVYNNLMNNQPMIEPGTGILNSIAFLKRLDEEVSKSNDFNTPISLLIFKVDNYSAVNNQLFQQNYDPINLHVINIIERFIKNYDVIGHLNDTTIAIVLLGLNLQHANNWSRRLRSEIASSSLSLNNRRFTVTISGGLAEYKRGDSTETFVQNTKMVLDIASQKGNNIKTYS